MNIQKRRISWILISKYYVDILSGNKLRTEKWDCMDTFFNIIFSNKNMGILKNRITTQADGFSLIDKELKTFIK